MSQKALIVAIFSLGCTIFFNCTESKKQNDKSGHESFDTCTMSPSGLPDLSGFRLGLHLADVRGRFPELNIKAKEGKDGLGTVELRNPSSSMPYLLGVIPRSTAPEQVFQIDTTAHPEFNDIENVRITFFESEIMSIDAYYVMKPQWTSAKVYIDETEHRFNPPITLRPPDKDMAALVCIDGANEVSTIMVGFTHVENKDYPAAFLVNGGVQLKWKDSDKGKQYLSNTNIAKQSNLNMRPDANDVQRVEIAGVEVKVGDDAYLSQDRLEKYLVKTVDNTDTYSYKGKTYEITYGPGERGAFFVRTIKVTE